MNKYFDKSMLVETDWLEKNYNKESVRIFDCTVWLNPHPTKIYTIESGKKDYDEEHIPNSDFLDLNEISQKNTPYPFMMPATEIFDDVIFVPNVSGTE